MTNADKIRNMSNEGLAEFIHWHNTKFKSVEQWLIWLQSEAK